MSSGFLKFFFFLFTTFLILQQSIAQTEISNYNFYTTKQGLSSNSINDLAIDNKGFLWIATANGLNRFDGNRFRQFSDIIDTIATALNILAIGQDSLGEIYCASKSEDGMSYYHNSTWYKFPSLKLSQKISSLSFAKIQFENSNIWILTNTGKLIKYNKSTQKSLLYDSKYYFNKRNNFYIHENDLIINVQTPSVTSFIHYKVKSDSIVPFDTLFSINISSNYNQEFLFDNLGNIFFSLSYDNTNGFKTKIVQYFDRFNHNLTTLYKTTGKYNLFDITISKDKRLYIIDLPFIKIFDINRRILDEYFVKITENENNLNQKILCLKVDDFENLWLGTDINGLIKINLNSIGFKSYFTSSDNSSNYIRSLLIFKKDLFVGTKNGKIFRINSQLFFNKPKIKDIKDLFDSSFFPINCIGVINDNTVAYQKNGFLYFYDLNHKNKYNTGIQIVDNLWTMWSNKRNNIWLGSIRNGIHQYNYFYSEKWGKFILLKKLNEFPYSYVPTIFEDSDKELWLSTEVGLILLNKIKNRIKSLYQLTNKDLSCKIGKNIWQIYEEKPGYIWIGSTDGGLSCLEKNSGKVTNYLQKDGLPNNTISGILPDNKGNLWIGTISGLSKFNLSDRTFTNYDEDDGLLTSDFNFNACSRSDDGVMFWGTKKGIVYFNPDSIHKVRGPLVITSVRVNDKEIKTELFNKDTLILKHNENIFSFEFAILDYSNSSKWNLEYMLVGFDKYWKKSLLLPPSATYTNIPPGHYNFRIRTANFDEHHNRKEIEIQIIVKPAFWQTTWFFIIIGIIFCIFLIFIFREYQKKMKMKRKLLQVEIDSLRAQMNPHFIFNSLNSIQDFILNNNKEIASFYLAKFAKLMRLILENSKKTTITIEEEVDFLNLYLYLEKMRLNDNLEITIFIDENINIFEDKIPPMLLQPIIENSIKHGLAPKKGKRELSIYMSKDNNIIKCTITDNGIGREAANTNLLYIKKEKSRGSELINNRLSLLSLIYNKDFHFDIEDLIDTNGIPSGTKVIIYIGDNME
ncbi:MAG: histidine kinase [Bacteroidetes bacterium]|nr:histidine kinase [Bacteroidota bacterium]